MSVNKIILVGRLGADPESRYAPTGMQIANFSLATNEKRKNEKHTEWFKIIAFDKLASTVVALLKKGSLTYVEGRVQSRKYTDKAGIERTITEVIANGIQILEPREQENQEPLQESQDLDDGLPF
jgi:single-strand DNA-binding protein